MSPRLSSKPLSHQNMRNGRSQPLQNLSTFIPEAHGTVFPDRLHMTKARISLEASGSSRRRRSQMGPPDTSPELFPRDSCRYQEWTTLRDTPLFLQILPPDL